MDDYLIKQINTDLSNNVNQYNDKLINHAITIIRNGYSTEENYLNEDQLLDLLSQDSTDGIFHTKRIAANLFNFQEKEKSKTTAFTNLGSLEQDKYISLVYAVVNQLNDNSLLNRIRRFGNQFIYISSKMQQHKF